MATIERNVTRYYSTEESALAAARILTANEEDGWTYHVEESLGRPGWIVRIFDESGHFIANWGI